MHLKGHHVSFALGKQDQYSAGMEWILYLEGSLVEVLKRLPFFIPLNYNTGWRDKRQKAFIQNSKDIYPIYCLGVCVKVK